MNDPLDQMLQGAVMNLKNRLDTHNVNNQTQYDLPVSYKAEQPTTRRMDIKSMFTGQGMPELEEKPKAAPPPRVGMYFEAALPLIDPDTVGPGSLGNVPPTPQPPAGCPTSGTVTCVLSGIASCGCVDGTTSTISINGTYTLTWDSVTSTFKITAQGSWSNQLYNETNCVTPTGSPTTGTWDIIAACSGEDIWAVAVQDTGGSGFTAFSTSSGQPIGSPISNNLVCSGSGGPLVGGGTATIS